VSHRTLSAASGGVSASWYCGASAMTTRSAWVYLERMPPHALSMAAGKTQWGGGAYRIRLFGDWDGNRRQEKYLTQVAFWIWRGFPSTPALRARLERAKRGDQAS
jgi:hypothetical protein